MATLFDNLIGATVCRKVRNGAFKRECTVVDVKWGPYHRCGSRVRYVKIQDPKRWTGWIDGRKFLYKWEIINLPNPK